MAGSTWTNCAPYDLTNSGPLRREFCMMSFARYTKISWRSGLARSASVAQTEADSSHDFLWYCTQWLSVWIDCCESFSFESFPLNDSAVKEVMMPAILAHDR